MPKTLRTFIEDVKKKLPGEFIRITEQVNPADFGMFASTVIVQNNLAGATKGIEAINIITVRHLEVLQVVRPLTDRFITL